MVTPKTASAKNLCQLIINIPTATDSNRKSELQVCYFPKENIPRNLSRYSRWMLTIR